MSDISITEPLEIQLFGRLVDDFADAFRCDDEAVRELHQTCLTDGLSKEYICLARKMAAVAFVSQGAIYE